MIFLISTVFFAILIYFFFQDVKNTSLRRSVLSLFWFFSYIYFINYFLNPVIYSIDTSILYKHMSKRIEDSYILAGIISALWFWTLFLFGYKKSKVYVKDCASNVEISTYKLRFFAAMSVFLSLFILHDEIYNFIFNAEKIEVFSFSLGNGWKILLLEFPFFGFIYYLVFIYTKDKRSTLGIIDWMIITSIIFILFLYTVLLSTRRAFAIVFFGFLFLISLKRKSVYISLTLLLTILLLPYISSILNIIRGLSVYDLIMNPINIVSNSFIILKSTIVRTFEGHLLFVLYKTAEVKELILGINPFLIFENVLNFIPRFFWEQKPLDLGSMEIQKYLLPNSFYQNGLPKSTDPPTILVEFIYSFGIVGTSIIMYFLGKSFRYIETIFFSKGNDPILAFVYFYTYLYMFNFVRSPLSFGINLIVPILILWLLTTNRKRGV